MPSTVERLSVALEHRPHFRGALATQVLIGARKPG
jgi:hypothetical protein